jgi:hypothetical protein
MSISDIVGSVGIGLVTLPMPSPGDYWTDSYNIQGPRIGNTQTCTAQGFFITLGCYSFFMYYYVSLNIYYLCAIGLKMRIETMVKYLEPLIHGMPIFSSLLIALPPLFRGDYNAPNEYPFCNIGPKPWFCNNDENGIECIRGESVSTRITTNYNSTYIIALFVIQCLCLGILCWKVYQQERLLLGVIEQDAIIARMKTRRRGQFTLPSPSATPQLWTHQLRRMGIIKLNQEGTKYSESTIVPLGDGMEMTMEESVGVAEDQYKETKIIAEQAMVYILSSCILEISWYLSSLLSIGTQMVLQSVIYALSNLQGFFILFIFTFHKVYNMKRCNSDLTTVEVLIRIFRDGEVHDSFVLTSMDVVSQNYSSANYEEQYDDFYDNGNDDDDTRAAPAPPPLPSLDWADLRSKLNSGSMKVTNANYDTTTSIVLSYGASANVGSASSRLSRMSFGVSSFLDSSTSKLRTNCISGEEKDKSFSSSLLSYD